jgi:hypothetical protein
MGSKYTVKAWSVFEEHAIEVYRGRNFYNALIAMTKAKKDGYAVVTLEWR